MQWIQQQMDGNHKLLWGKVSFQLLVMDLKLHSSVNKHKVFQLLILWYAAVNSGVLQKLLLIILQF